MVTENNQIFRSSDSQIQEGEPDEADKKLRYFIHTTVMRVSRDIEERFNFNTAIAAIMEFVNYLSEYLAIPGKTNPGSVLPEEALSKLIILLAPLTPHIAEELWQKAGKKGSVHLEPWPSYDERYTVLDEVEIVIQINGKIRDKLNVPASATAAELEDIARGSEKIKALLEGKEIRKVIAVPGRLVNIVV